MAKKFMYVCLGILALVLAFHLGARYGQAGYVDHSATGIVVLSGDILLLDTGEAYEVGTNEDPWRPRPDYTPPVPVSEIRFWGGYFLSTYSNEVWHRGGTFPLGFELNEGRGGRCQLLTFVTLAG